MNVSEIEWTYHLASQQKSIKRTLRAIFVAIWLLNISGNVAGMTDTRHLMPNVLPPSFKTCCFNMLQRYAGLTGTYFKQNMRFGGVANCNWNSTTNKALYVKPQYQANQYFNKISHSHSVDMAFVKYILFIGLTNSIRTKYILYKGG